jgi:hypothetical protein
MNASKGLQRKLLTAGAIVAPIVLVQLLRGFGGFGPGSAHASGPMPSDATASAPIEPAAGKCSPEVARITAWIRAQNTANRPQSPLDYLPAAPAPKPMVNPYAGKDIPAPAAKPDDVSSKLIVGAIFGNAQGQSVSINGKVYSVGDEPLAGWLITKIDPKAYVVHLIGPSDQMIQLTVRAGESKRN